MVANICEVEILQGIVNWAKEDLTTEEVTKLLLAKDNNGRTVFNVARKLYELEVFQGILNWIKENLTREEINKLLLATDNDGRTVLHVAAREGRSFM